MKRKQSGFTLIELLVTIIILGVLSVTVALKLTEFHSEAYVSQLKNLKAAIISSAQSAHAKAVIANVEDYPFARLPILPGPRTHFRFGYPAANNNGIGNLVEGLEKREDWTFMDSGGKPHIFYVTFKSKVGAVSSSKEVEKIVSSSCYLKYEDVTAKGEKPVVSLVLDKC